MTAPTMHPHRRQIDAVLDLVTRYPGLCSRDLQWLAAGGDLGPGGPRGTVTLSMPDMIRVTAVPKRLADLVRERRVELRPLTGRHPTAGQGYYAAGPGGQDRNEGRRRLAELAERLRAETGTG